MQVEIETIAQFRPLHDPEHPSYYDPYQVYYGGRGGRKSWEVARALLIRGMREKKLVLCTREIQNTIADSVLRLLASQIEMLGMGYFWDVQKTTIIGRNGTEFIFKGLNSITIDGIKSLEGTDICWVEEGHSVSDKSWEILIPTIRKAGSQMFVTFNPDQPDDPVMTRFVVKRPPACYVAKVSYLDNPDCPQKLIDEANYLKEVDYEAYAHVWLGEVRAHTDAQVFKAKYQVSSFEPDSSFGDPLYGVDWGFSVDPTVMVRLFVKEGYLYIRDEAYKVHCEVDHTDSLFDRVPGSRKYRVRADNARPELISHMRRKGFNMTKVDKWPGCVQDRIDFMRNFRQIIIHPDCTHTAEEMRLYSYKIDKRTGDILPDVVDKHNHCIDAIGYALTPIIRKHDTDPNQLKNIFQ